MKDIVERNGIEREDILGDILDFLASQIQLSDQSNQYCQRTGEHEEREGQSYVDFKLHSAYHRLVPYLNGEALRCQG